MRITIANAWIEARGDLVKWYGILLGAMLGIIVGTIIGYLLVPGMLK